MITSTLTMFGVDFYLFLFFVCLFAGEGGSISEHMTMTIVLRFWMMVSKFVCIYAQTCGEICAVRGYQYCYLYGN